jgi:hypothetical protein
MTQRKPVAMTLPPGCGTGTGRTTDGDPDDAGDVERP